MQHLLKNFKYFPDLHNVYVRFQVLIFSKSLFAQFLHQRAEKQNYMNEGSYSNKKQEEYYRLHRRMVAMKGTNSFLYPFFKIIFLH